MIDLIRSACLTHYAEVARSVGLEPRHMLKQVRLPLRCLENPDLRIAVTGVRRLLVASAAASGADEFGLRMAERSGLANLGPVALVVREQATVGAAIETLARYIHLHDEAMRLRVERQDDVITIAVFLRGGQTTRQSTEWAVGLVYRILRSLFNDAWRPLGIHFAHAPPRSRRFHRQFFGTGITFNSDLDAIQCSVTDMARPILTSHPMLARYVESRVEAIEVRPESWDDKVGELVRTLLPGGNCTIETVAEHLSCDRRTVHRRLLECSTTFSAILDAERSDVMMRLVEDANRPLKEIAGLLGFSAQSALARWFRGKFGCSITTWRTDGRQRAIAAARW